MRRIKNFLVLSASLALSTWCQLAPAQPCPTSMRYLDASLPKYPVAELEKNREAIISDSVKDVFDALQKLGAVSNRAAGMLKQANMIEEWLPRNEECFQPYSSNPAAAVRDVMEGRWKFASRSFNDLSFKDMCAFQVTIQYYGMVATREMGMALSCMATNVR